VAARAVVFEAEADRAERLDLVDDGGLDDAGIPAGDEDPHGGRATRICDALGMTDEHERGMVRMLVNTLLWTTLCVTFALVAWLLLE
jgi:hypothetical protein